MTKFEGLPKPLARALTDQGYETLTPVQEAVNAPDMGGDLLVSAQTGSGKTVAFGMAMSVDLLGDEDILPKAGRPLALVISPTRELAMQVKSELTWLYKHAKSQLASCVGGMDTRSEVRTLDRGAHIVVGTPGRLVDHIKRRSLDLSQLEVVVMDEADEMLDLGFREDLEFILEHTPEERRTLLFSATVPPAINKLAQTFQKDAKRLELKSKNTQHSDIDYQALVCTPHDREKAMINLMRFHDPRATVIFCGTRAEVTNLSAKLHNRGFSVVSLSGALSQDERSNALQAMRDGRARVCVATDVAARGIDLPGLELVIHADLPQNTEALLHRSGRTGRAGRKGISALIVTLKQQGKAKRLLKWAKVDANWQNPPSADMVRERDKGRMLEMIADDSLMAQVGEEDLVAEIIEKASPQHVAAAFLSLYRTGKSAPEELNEVSVDGGKPKEERPNFEKSVWISLSVGRDESAGPRWLLPMVCEAGGINKKSIGAIRIQQNNTFVELNEDISESFFAMLGDKMTLEDRVGVERVDGKPEFEARPERPPRRNDRGDRGDRRGGGGGGFKGKPRFDDDRGPRKPHRGKDDFKPRGDKPKGKGPKKAWDDKPKGDRPKKDWGDKPRKDGFKKDDYKKDGPKKSGGKGDWAKKDGDKKPFKKSHDDRGSDMPREGGFKGSSNDAPRRGGKPFGKAGAKGKGKPAGKPKSPKGKFGFDPSNPSAGRKQRGKPGGKR